MLGSLRKLMPQRVLLEYVQTVIIDTVETGTTLIREDSSIISLQNFISNKEQIVHFYPLFTISLSSP